MTPTNTVDITSALKIIETASNGSDRYLFVSTFAILLGVFYLIFRHLVKQSSDLASQAREDSLAMKKLLLDMNERAIERSERLGAIVAENTEIICETRSILERVNNKL